MPTQFSAILRRTTRTVSGFTTGQKVVSILVLAGLLLGGVAFSKWASAPTYSPLFSNLASSDASAIVDKLNSAGVKYQLADGGQSILVPQKDVYAERLKMSSAGLPSAKNTGYTLLDQQGVTASQFQQQIAYQRALEGEMDNTIEAIDGVQTAVVHLAIPQQDVFLDDSQKPTASVLVSMSAGSTLGQEQVQSIVHLVSSSIEGMDASQVTVVDGNGNLLSAAGDTTSTALAGDTRDQATSDYDTQTTSAVQALLDRVLGPGHAVAKVTAQLDLDNTNTTTETMIVPTATAPPLSYSKSLETYGGTGGAAAGNQAATGVLGPDNIAVPSGDAMGASATTTGSAGSTSTSTSTSGAGSGYIKESVTADNPYGKVTQQRQSAPGAVIKQSVAVIVDSSVKGVNLTTLQQAVSSAAGVDATRGDTISVTSMAFDTTAAAAAKKELAAAASATSRGQFFGMIKTAAVVLLVLLVLGIAFLMSRKRSTSESTMLDLELLENARMSAGMGAGGAAGALGMGGSTAIGGGPGGLGAAAIGANPAFGGGGEISERRQAVHAMVERQPDEVAELLRGWLADRRG